MANLLLCTQATQSTKNKFYDFMVQFYREYEKRFIHKTHPTEDIKFKRNCRKFFDSNNHEDGKKYKYIFRDLANKSKEDGGEFLLKIIKAFFVLIPYAEIDEIHRFYILSNCWQFFESEHIQTEYLLECSSIFKYEAQKTDRSCQKLLFEKAMSLIKSGDIKSYRSMQLTVLLSTLPGNKEKFQNKKDLYFTMLKECKVDGVHSVAEVVRDSEEYVVFHNFARDYLNVGLNETEEKQKQGLSKLNAFWRDFTDPEIHDIIMAFCKHWADIDSIFLCNLDDEIEELSSIIHKHPLVGKSFVKLFKKDNHLRKSTFAIVLQLVLMTSQRYEQDISHHMSSTLCKLWSYADDVKSDGWIREVIEDLKLSNISERFETIISAIKDNKVLYKTLSSSLVTLSLLLISTGVKKDDFKVIDGKLKQSKTSIAFIGKSMLVNTITADPRSSNCESLLRSIVNCIFSYSSNHNICYVLIDSLIEIREKMVEQIVDNWASFEKLIQNIWVFTSEIVVKIMSALMPIINRQQGLRKQLFETLRIHILSPTKVATALPVMLQLLRSLTDQPESKFAFQCSQSFATFSSQVAIDKSTTDSSDVIDTIQIFECIKRCLHQSPITKCLVYRGIVDICKKNNFFAIQGLDLLSNEVKNLPQFKVEEYVERTKSGAYLKHPLPYLLKAVTSLISVVVYIRENRPPAGATQVIDNGLAIVRKTDALIDSFIAIVLKLELEDFDLNKMNEQLMKGTTNNIHKLFGMMLVDLYDVVIEHLWTSDMDTDAILKRNLANIISKRRKLVELLESIKKKGNEDNTLTRLSSIGLGDLQVDVPKLTNMLENIGRQNLSNYMAYDEYPLQDLLVEWVMLRIHEAATSLDTKSGTAIASLKGLTELAKQLHQYFYDSDIDDNVPLAIKKIRFTARSRGVEAFSMIIQYILTKYECRSVSSLKTIYKQTIELNTSSGSLPMTQAAQTQRSLVNIAARPPPQGTMDDANDPGYNQGFRTIAMSIICQICENSLPSLIEMKDSYDSNKCIPEYQRQMVSFIHILRKLSSMFASTADRQRATIYKFLMDGAKKYDFGDKNITLEYWRTAMELIVKSNTDESWVTSLGSLVEGIVTFFDDASNADPDQSTYKSVNKKWAPSLIVIIAETVSKLYKKITRAVDIKLEMDEPLNDEFFTTIFTTIGYITDVVLIMVRIDRTVFIADEQLWTNIVSMINEMYGTMNCMVNQFNNLVLSKTDIDDWNSLQLLSNLCQGVVNEILETTKHTFGTVNYTIKKKTNNVALLLSKKTKRDEKLFTRYEKELESFHIGLLMLEQKFGTKDRPLKLSEAENRTYRDFRINFNNIENNMSE